MTTCCKLRLEILGVGFQEKKFQITKHKSQINHNDRNSKSQSIDGFVKSPKVGNFIISHIKISIGYGIEFRRVESLSEA